MKRTFATICAIIIAVVIAAGSINAQTPGWIKGDFHQHTTFTDGSFSFYHVMGKNYRFGLDWWANSEHGGGFNRNGFTSGTDLGNSTNYWSSYNFTIQGTASGNPRNMWRWQSIRDVSWPGVLTTRSLYPDKLIVQGLEWNVPGHEHASMACLSRQVKSNPNANYVAEFEFKFDNSDGDLTGGVAQGWTKSTKSGHEKAVEGAAWLQKYYSNASWIVPAHPERKNLWNVASFRDMNNAAPDVFFGFESMPGHQKGADRGEYKASNNTVGTCTYGGVGIYSAKVGGLWDAMLSEGRKFWLFANSDFHNETADFYPGEYQKTYTYVTDSKDMYQIVHGLRSGNSWVVLGDLIDVLDFRVENAKMGETIVFNKSTNELNIYIKVHDPQGNNNNTYSSYTNPVLNHIDLIAGKVGSLIAPNHPDYTKDFVTTTSVVARFDAVGGVTDDNGIVSTKWNDLGDGWKEMTITIQIDGSMYFRLRGSNLGLNVTNETDANGNPLADNLMGSNDAGKAYADLWFYSNPVFVKYSKKNIYPNTMGNANNSFYISPNPANEQVTFSSADAGELQITDAMGNIYGKFNVVAGERNIDIRSWGNGNYIFTFNNGTQVSSKNLKVQR